ncbi:cell wall-binding protein [Clostridium sp. PL3]|uniref:Cell wall-binding protein n=1 Tax=Clostridium thailandense TaxID=2794346 RepID=A0A949WQA2_9CLOT|nr:cell wall-binding protein [Clostridium thailandense]MBV7272496.1 cell wall-binding protein [Clostridium thailandense]
MKKQNLKRIITAGLIVTGILTIAPSAKAEYTPNTTNLCYTKGTSLIMVLKLINEKLHHFDNNDASPSELVNNNSDSNNIFDQSIEQAVGEAIKSRNQKYYYMGEVATEGHIILEVEEKDDLVKAYTISSFGYFGFENGIFTIVSGSGAIPTVITFSKNANNEYSLLEYKEPIDGDDCLDSTKKMFPERLWNRVLSGNDLVYSKLVESQKSQAEEYLRKIGRTAQVNPNYVERKLPDINVSASNKLFSELTKYDSLLNDCPYWIGSRERIENGIRIVYETSQSKSSDGYDLITFKKSKADGTIIEERIYKIVGSEPELQQ